MNASCVVFAAPLLQIVHEGAGGVWGEACKYAAMINQFFGCLSFDDNYMP